MSGDGHLTLANPNLPTPAPSYESHSEFLETPSSNLSEMQEDSSRRRSSSSLFEKLKSKIFPTPEQKIEKEAIQERQKHEQAETHARLERMRVGMDTARKTGIPQWVNRDTQGRDQFVVGPLGEPSGWIYPEGGYNINIGPLQKTKGLSGETTRVASSTSNWG